MVALGSGLLGGVLGPWVGLTRERRGARSELLKAIHRTRSCWHPTGDQLLHDVPWNASLEAAVDELESLALIAGAPRMATYGYLAALRKAADAPSHEGNYGEWILDDRDMFRKLWWERERLVRCLWHPWMILVPISSWRRLAKRRIPEPPPGVSLLGSDLQDV